MIVVAMKDGTTQKFAIDGPFQGDARCDAAGALVIYEQWDGGCACGENAVGAVAPGLWVTWRHGS